MAKVRRTCLVPKCDRPVHSRGLCHRDYDVALRLVIGKKITWDILERNGKALPPMFVTVPSRYQNTVEWFMKNDLVKELL